MARARSPLTMEGVEISSLSSPHFNMSISNHSTTRKSWRSDAPIILPGWEYHTGGSRSKPTVHRCRPKTGGCGLLTRTQNEPTKTTSSQEWKSGAAEHDRSEKPEENSWDSLQKVDPPREEPLLGRNAHSARYGESIHDRTGKPVSEILQEQANFENFVMGSDDRICESSQRPSANSTEKNVKHCRVLY